MLCSHEVLSSENKDMVAELCHGLQTWDGFLARCLRHSSFPLVYRNLSGANTGHDTYGRAVGILRRRVLLQWMPHRAKLEREQLRVKTALDGAGLPYAFLRGLPFGFRFYLDGSVRVTEDVDLLVRPEHYQGVRSALLDAGYRYREEEIVRESRARYMGQTEFIHCDTGVLVDLNWQLTGNGGIGSVMADVDALWDRAQPGQGAEFRLSPEDLLADTVRHCVQGHDLCSRILKTCCDVAAILRTSPDLDRDLVLRQLTAGECVRGFELFMWFYEKRYRVGGNVPSLLGKVGSIGRAEPLEGILLCSAMLRLKVPPPRERFGVVREFFYECLKLMAKLWSTDSLARLGKLQTVLIRPSWDERVLLLGGERPFYWYALLAVVMLPGAACGTALRLFSVLLSFFSKSRPPVASAVVVKAECASEHIQDMKD